MIFRNCNKSDFQASFGGEKLLFTYGFTVLAFGSLKHLNRSWLKF